ncbi:amino acid ABC transporter permease [Sphaerisporangium sp. NPDC051011]|uniref:amino acid ABC transporter permease n=1 Tax=Sphaerisporangium sp. NPDC051011 TaxID=3155792 RepID=UPI0033C572F4
MDRPNEGAAGPSGRVALHDPGNGRAHTAERTEDLQLPTRSRRGYGGIAAAVLASLVIIDFVQSFARNKVVGWSVVGDYLFDHRILEGVGRTIGLTFVSMALALVIAVIIAIMRLSENAALRRIASGYVWFFRSMPILVLLIVTFNLALIYPEVTIGIPGGPTLFSASTNDLITPYWAAVMAFSINESSYASEILRTSILAVAKGQTEAGMALAMNSRRIYARIILPQAIRIAVPPLGNETIKMLKETSLVAFISVFDLMYTVQSIYQVNYKIFPLLMVATIWYIVLVSILSLIQAAVERRLRGSRRSVGMAWRRAKREATNG